MSKDDRRKILISKPNDDIVYKNKKQGYIKNKKYKPCFLFCKIYRNGVIFIEIITTPTNDYTFKRIFGKPGNEDVAENLLNLILNEKIKNVKLDCNTILEKDIYDDKIGILDIKAKLNDEILCNIEMQVAN